MTVERVGLPAALLPPLPCCVAWGIKYIKKILSATNPGNLGAGRGLGVGQDLRDARALRRLHEVRLHETPLPLEGLGGGGVEGEEEKKGEEEEEEEGRRTWAAGFGVSGGPGFLVMLVKEGWRPAPGRGRRDLGGGVYRAIKTGLVKSSFSPPMCASSDSVFRATNTYYPHTDKLATHLSPKEASLLGLKVGLITTFRSRILNCKICYNYELELA